MVSLSFICVVSWLCVASTFADDISNTSPNTPASSSLGQSTAAATSPIMDSSTKASDAIGIDTKGTTVESGAGSSTVSANESSSTTTTISNTANKPEEVGTTPSWELIYPDPNSTLSDDTSMPLVDHTFSVPSAAMDGGVTKYFKIDDVVNCEKYFGECLRQVLTNVMPKLRNGVNDTRLPRFDPFYVNRTSLQYNGGPLNGRITVGYAYVYGLTSMKYRKVSFKRTPGNTFKIRLSTVIPTVQAKGTYKADLKLNSVNVRPNGVLNITLHGVAIEQLGYGEIYERDQHRFLKLTSMNVTAALRDAKINATGLIADMRLNEIILNVANQYWRDIFNIVLPETQDNWSPIIMNAVNGALSMVPFDFLVKV